MGLCRRKVVEIGYCFYAIYLASNIAKPVYQLISITI
jgi:hypothetical protein